MDDCIKCDKPIKCCHNCRKDTKECDVWHHCGRDCPEWEPKALTNADRIRSMSDEEMADFLTEFSFEAFAAGAIKFSNVIMDAQKRLLWLQQPAEEESHGVD